MTKTDLKTRLVLQLPQLWHSHVYATMYIQQVSLQSVDDDFAESRQLPEEQDRPYVESQARDRIGEEAKAFIP